MSNNINQNPTNKKNAIICENICKDYPMYSSFSQKLKGIFFKNDRVSKFRALNDISVTMKQGECVGLIGLNGSGKSTLASIITGITTPSSGNIRVKGEVSMLAASSGMRMQLSGIDNIRFKCLLMGFPDDQIKTLEKDIVEFADIGMHINQPVKTYSSGMRSRLGFAIAVHINPEILIIDEALSVGDSSFTDKCLNKINEFKKEGKTIVFVSHSTSAMSSFCDRIIWLHQGKIVGVDVPDKIIRPYSKFAKEFNSMSNEQRKITMPDLKQYQQDCGVL